MGCGNSKNESVTPGQGEPSSKPATTQETSTEKTKPVVTKSNDTAAKGSNTTGSSEFITECVNKHNQLRALHGAGPMKEAADLTEYSQKWADHLAKTDNMKHSDCTLPSGGRVGENLFCCWSSNPEAGVKAADAVQSWYDEIKDYDFNNGTFSMETGHFTQVVWKGSTELGVAFAKAPKGTWYVVCNYRPAGNMTGDFQNNVLPNQ